MSVLEYGVAQSFNYESGDQEAQRPLQEIHDKVSSQADICIRKDGKRSMILAGGLGLLAVGFIAAAPELGFLSAVGGVLAGSGSALVSFIAKR